MGNCLSNIQLIQFSLSNESWSSDLLSSTSILNKQGLLILIKWLQKPIQKIVFKFKASSNDFRLPKYYEECGDLTNTIIMVKTTKNKIIGAFTPLSFNPCVNWTSDWDEQWIKDESNSSFLFSLSQKQKFQLIQQDKYAINRRKDKMYISFSPVLKIYDNSNTGKYNSFALGTTSTYNTSKYSANKQNYLKIIGQQNLLFLTQQWEVYQVFF